MSLSNKEICSMFGRIGGSATSARKAAAARDNGKKGGRPTGTGKKRRHTETAGATRSKDSKAA